MESITTVPTRRTFAIISHPDAGKTTLTEKLLLYGGAVQLAGSVTARKNQRATTSDWMELEKKRGISISMDGRGRALDNVFIERLWRSLKYELIYPSDFATGQDLFPALENYFHFYNHQRPHQALGYQTPADFYPHRSQRKR